MNKLRDFIGTCLLISLAGCFNPDDYKSPEVEKIVWLVSGDTTVAADASSSAKIVAAISSGAAIDRRKVVFKTTAGTFKGGAGDSIVIEADEKFQATAYLTNIKTGTSKVSVKARTVKSEETMNVEFIKAFPEKITVTVDSFSIENNFKSEILVLAVLSLENGGKPTFGHRVEFQVTDSDGNDAGYFLNGDNFSFTGTDGKATIRYTAGETAYTGELTITARTVTSGGTIEDTTIIYLTE